MELLLGVNSEGIDVTVDLETIRDMFIGGMHKSGKTNYITYLVTSLATQYTPSELQFLLVNEKKDEFRMFERLSHLAHPIINDLDECAINIQWLYSEMERRYRQIARAHNKNIIDYNESAEEKIPRIFFIVDECVSLFQREDKNSIEKILTQILSLGKGVGIHFIFTTAYSSDNAVPPMLRVHFNTMGSFAVATEEESTTFLNFAGAEKLKNSGDLFISLSTNKYRPIILHIPLMNSHPRNKNSY